MAEARNDIIPRVETLGRSGTVWVAGSGERLLLLHGWGLGPGVYATCLRRLAEQGFEVAAPALAVVGKRWSIERAVHRAEKAMDALGWDSAIVAGNSLGGAVAIALAAKDPKRVSLLVLVNSVGLPLERGIIGWVTPLRRYVTAANLRAASTFGRNMVAGRGALNLAGAAWYARRAALADELATIRRNRVRSVVIWGEDDRLLPLEMGRQVAETLRAPLRLVPGAEHDWTVRYPELFARELEIAIHATQPRVRGAGPLEQLFARRRAAKRDREPGPLPN